MRGVAPHVGCDSRWASVGGAEMSVGDDEKILVLRTLTGLVAQGGRKREAVAAVERLCVATCRWAWAAERLFAPVRREARERAAALRGVRAAVRMWRARVAMLGPRRVAALRTLHRAWSEALCVVGDRLTVDGGDGVRYGRVPVCAEVAAALAAEFGEMRLAACRATEAMASRAAAEWMAVARLARWRRRRHGGGYAVDPTGRGERGSWPSAVSDFFGWCPVGHGAERERLLQELTKVLGGDELTASEREYVRELDEGARDESREVGDGRARAVARAVRWWRLAGGGERRCAARLAAAEAARRVAAEERRMVAEDLRGFLSGGGVGSEEEGPRIHLTLPARRRKRGGGGGSSTRRGGGSGHGGGGGGARKRRRQVAAERDARRKREREEFAEAHRRQRARARAEEAAVDCMTTGGLPTISQIVDRIEFRRRAELRAERARRIRQQIQHLMSTTGVGVRDGVGYRRARILVRRARCHFGRTDVLHLLTSFASSRASVLS